MVTGRLLVLLFVQFLLGVLVGHFIRNDTLSYELNYRSTVACTQPPSVVVPRSNILFFNLTAPSNDKLPCIKTKTLLNHINTHVCLHENSKDVFVSSSFRGTTSIWEEEGVVRILQLLLRHPHLDFIDIGANIGTYTMYVASLGRFVLGIDCFAPNLERIHRAVQLANVANRVLLVENALFRQSGQSLRLSNDAKNIGGQALNGAADQANNLSAINDPYIVKTIRFDELLPTLLERGVRGALMKVDIEGSESFVVESGSQVFDQLDIPFILMEWMNVRQYPDRVQVLLEFFQKRNYEPRTYSCQGLNPEQQSVWPSDICWVKRNASGFC
jgi:FkbM family methyltransferase